MVSEVVRVQGRCRFHRSAHRHVADYDFVQASHEFIACHGDGAVLLQQAVDRQAQGRVPDHEARQGGVFARMVNAVGELPQVRDDIQRQAENRPLAVVELGDLLIQDVEKPSEIGMLGMP